jgi:hypothetical protein
MLIQRTGTKTEGDWQIDRIQQDVYFFLKEALNISDDSSYDCYGRIYKMDKKGGGGLLPYYTNDTGEYTELLWDDTKKAISFFYVNGEKTDNGQKTDKLQFYFMCNLDTLLTSTDREDALVRAIVFENLHTNQGYYVNDTIIGLDKIFNEFPGAKSFYKVFDMQPLHCFRLDGTICYPIGATQLLTPINNF